LKKMFKIRECFECWKISHRAEFLFTFGLLTFYRQMPKTKSNFKSKIQSGFD
jgi:hypothetical protein